jgi:hypothetical protein
MGRIELFDRLEVRKLMWSRCLIDLHDSNPSSMSELGQSTKSLRSSPLRGGKSRDVNRRGVPTPIGELSYCSIER